MIMKHDFLSWRNFYLQQQRFTDEGFHRLDNRKHHNLSHHSYTLHNQKYYLEVIYYSDVFLDTEKFKDIDD